MEYVKLVYASTMAVYALLSKNGPIVTRYTAEFPGGYLHEPSLRYFYGSILDEDSEEGSSDADHITKAEFDEILSSWTND